MVLSALDRGFLVLSLNAHMVVPPESLVPELQTLEKDNGIILRAQTQVSITDESQCRTVLHVNTTERRVCALGCGVCRTFGLRVLHGTMSVCVRNKEVMESRDAAKPFSENRRRMSALAEYPETSEKN